MQLNFAFYLRRQIKGTDTLRALHCVTASICKNCWEDFGIVTVFADRVMGMCTVFAHCLMFIAKRY